VYLLLIEPTAVTPAANWAASLSAFTTNPGIDSKIVQTSGDATKKLAPPRKVNWWILLDTLLIFTPKVWNHAFLVYAFDAPPMLDQAPPTNSSPTLVDQYSVVNALAFNLR